MGLLKISRLPMVDKQIAKAMKVGQFEDVILEKDDGECEQGDTFLIFYNQAKRPISWKALLAGYKSTWLKICVIPSPAYDGTTPVVILPAIQLVYRQPVGLLFAIVYRIQNGLRMLTEQFCRRVTTT